VKVKVITVQQPWAWAIAAGHKPVENRTWRTSYRGPLAIHAGKAWDLRGAPFFRRICELLRIPLPEADSLPRGKVVAVASGVDICNRSLGSGNRVVCDCGPWAMPGQFHWRLKDVRELAEPFPCSGKQGLWEVDLPDDLVMGGAR
jgi:hypothetical protein